MTHSALIAAHAIAATLALVAALLALRSTRFVGAHACCTTVMALTLAPALWLSRNDNPRPLQLVFLGLLALSVGMSHRAIKAWRHRAGPGAPLGPRYVGHVGFNVIGLVTGFATVGVLDLGWGSIAVVGVAVVIPVGGHYLLARAQRAAQVATLRR